MSCASVALKRWAMQPVNPVPALACSAADVDVDVDAGAPVDGAATSAITLAAKPTAASSRRPRRFRAMLLSRLPCSPHLGPSASELFRYSRFARPCLSTIDRRERSVSADEAPAGRSVGLGGGDADG